MKINLIILAVSMMVGIGDSYSVIQEKSLVLHPDTDKETGAWLGVSVRDLSSSLARSLNAATERGALVNEVFEDSPAERAGIREEDIVVRFNEQEIDGADDLVRAVRRASPGTSYSIEVVRGKDRKTFRAELEKRERRVRMHSFRMPHISRFSDATISGMHVMTLGEQLAEYFGIPDRRGVLVTEVKKESPAEKAGIKAGDVIMKADGERIDDIADLDDALSSKDAEENIDLTVFRKGAAKSVTLAVGKRKGLFYHFGPKRFHFDRDWDLLFDSGEWKEWEEDLRKSLEDINLKLRISLPHFTRHV